MNFSNILVVLPSFEGGAPLSILQFLKEIKRHTDAEITAVASGERQSTEEQYKLAGIKTKIITKVQSLRSASGIKAQKKYFDELYSLTSELEPSVVFSVTSSQISVMSMITNRMNIAHIGVLPGADIPAKEEITSHWNCDRYIGFSFENKEYLMYHSIPEEKISVISNRIDISADEGYKDFYASEKSPCEMVTMSRLTAWKKPSLLSTMELARRLNEEGCDLRLSIAGDGDLKEFFEQEAERINALTSKETVRLLGHVTDVNSLCLSSHIFLGKGRSIIEPVMTGRIGIVAGDKDDMWLITKDNFDMLYRSNFSGRGAEHPDSFENIKQTVLSVNRGDVDSDSLLTAVDLMQENYNVSWLNEKFYSWFETDFINNEKSKTFKKNNFVFSIISLIKILFNSFASANKRKKLNKEN